MTALRVVLPLPPDALRVNRAMGMHWGSLAQLKATYQIQCAAAWKDAGRPALQGPWPVHLAVTVYLGKGQRCDAVDCLSWAKAGLDSLSRRMWPDDGASYLNPVCVTVRRDRERPRIELEVGA